MVWCRVFANSTSSLPADVANRRNLGESIPSDATALEAAGLQWEAEELRRRANIAELQRTNQQIDESRKIQQMDAQRRDAWTSMGVLERMGHDP